MALAIFLLPFCPFGSKLLTEQSIKKTNKIASFALTLQNSILLEKKTKPYLFNYLIDHPFFYHFPTSLFRSWTLQSLYLLVLPNQAPLFPLRSLPMPLFLLKPLHL